MSTPANNLPAPAPAAPAAPAPNGKRRQALTAIAAAVVLIGGAYAVWYWINGRHSESTDNAYVSANVVQITSQVPGTVLAINADDTDYVKAGQALVKLDPADARVALDQAEAQLAQSVRQVRTLYATNSTLQAQIDARAADVRRGDADLSRAQQDVDRRTPLVQSGAVGKEEYDHATSQLASYKSADSAARAALAAAQQQLVTNETQTEGTTVEQHPSVQIAAAKVRESWLALQRAEIPAPVTGYVARRSVQVGQRIQPGAPLMSVVTLNDAWVDANFKEGQLERIRIGQPVKLEADAYGKHVVYHGKVEGLGAGTGAAFSLLPAQNATGNWIKVVQRVPVRIALEPKEVQQSPLRVGLSMEVTVDVASQEGKRLADAPRPAQDGAVASTNVYDKTSQDANAEVARIIAENGGGRATMAKAKTSSTVDAAGTAPAVTGSASEAHVASAEPLVHARARHAAH
jgi:membrane fusion protein (multidrug efflux system)